jgi:hypothetical protein
MSDHLEHLHAKALGEFDRRKRFYDEAVSARKAAEIAYTDWVGTSYMREFTRRQRRFLVLIAIITLAVSFAGLVPTEIDALGIKLSVQDGRFLVWAVGLLVIYFWIEFQSSAIRDYHHWKERLQIAHRELVAGLRREKGQVRESFQNVSFVEESEKELDALIQKYEKGQEFAGFGRMGYVDYVLPTALGWGSILAWAWAAFRTWNAPG